MYDKKKTKKYNSHIVSIYMCIYMYVWYILRRNHANNWPAAATVEGLARNRRQTLSLSFSLSFSHTQTIK